MFLFKGPKKPYLSQVSMLVSFTFLVVVFVEFLPITVELCYNRTLGTSEKSRCSQAWPQESQGK